MTSIAQRIRGLRERQQCPQTSLAEYLKVTQPAVAEWEAGRAAPSRARVQKIAEFFGVSRSWLETGEGSPDIPQGQRSEIDFSRARPLTDMPKDLPVYGAARGGFSGDEVRLDSPIGYALRPPHLAGVTGAVAVIVVGDSMEPRYFSGEIVYVDQRLPARPRDFVLIELTEHRALVKRLVKITDQAVEIEQLNPAGRRKLPRAEVTGVFRIVGSAPGDSF